MLWNFQVFFSFLIATFFIKIKEYDQCQTVWIQIRPDMCLILSNLILVSTVCDAYQQMKLAGKELKAIGL